MKITKKSHFQYEYELPQRNRNFEVFHSKKIEKNRKNRKVDLKTPSSHFQFFRHFLVFSEGNIARFARNVAK